MHQVEPANKPGKKLSRRSFLKGVCVGTSALLLQACVGGVPAADQAGERISGIAQARVSAVGPCVISLDARHSSTSGRRALRRPSTSGGNRSV